VINTNDLGYCESHQELSKRLVAIMSHLINWVNFRFCLLFQATGKVEA